MHKKFATRFVLFASLSLVAGAFSANTNKFIQTPGSLLTKPAFREQNAKPSANAFKTFPNTQERKNTSMELSLSIRGGSVLAQAASNPTTLFNANLIALALTTAFIKISDKLTSKDNGNDEASPKPVAVKSLQIRFLSVFWLLRCADWLQGPYFYDVYSSKVFNGVPASLATVSRLFLTGFASTALFGPIVGRLSDSKGRKRGTLAFALLYSLGAASTKSNILGVLLLGRLFSGIGTSLLFSAPEAWLVGEATSSEEGGKYLGETFGMVSGFDLSNPMYVEISGKVLFKSILPNWFVNLTFFFLRHTLETLLLLSLLDNLQVPPTVSFNVVYFIFISTFHLL